ncbi:MAG: hypothetical protein VB021_05495 [Oscillospiraceae bacterium]|nr:hypothetical protein [Oscillospiraceae bacterium]
MGALNPVTRKSENSKAYKDERHENGVTTPLWCLCLFLGAGTARRTAALRRISTRIRAAAHSGKYLAGQASDLPTRSTNREICCTLKKSNILWTAYHVQLERKSQILEYLLDNYNDGRRKAFFCLAVNLLDVSDSENAVQQTEERISPEMTAGERSSVAVRCFEAAAEEKGIALKMNKKASKAKQTNPGPAGEKRKQTD